MQPANVLELPSEVQRCQSLAPIKVILEFGSAQECERVSWTRWVERTGIHEEFELASVSRVPARDLPEDANAGKSGNKVLKG